ncbi:hypothetical protein MSAN_00374800 [Mycena sanguinolenta]|uniref:Uncharacterized protein n=1 Tax=Mycena sanguinolenta TaxID=230812 RepID=A0A8H6ZCI1_9AGAR|nr:hypothetical protein MSAN_00374800 [Mycena sanguinolenta]
MKPIVSVLVLAVSAAAQLTIDTPVETSPSLTVLVQFDQQTNTSLTWPVNVAVGTQVVLSVKDATGDSATSAIFSVGSGDGSCISKTSSSASSTIFSSSAPSSSSQTTPPTTQPSSQTNPPSSPGTLTSAHANQSSHPANQSSSPATSSSASASQSSVPANTGSPVVGSKKKKSLIGPIVGGAVGGSLVVLVVLGLLLCRTRREDGPAFPDGFDEVQKQPLPQTPAQTPPVMNSLARTPQTQWSPEQLFTILPSGETQLSSLAAPMVPRGILADEEKAQRAAADRLGLLQKEIRELQQLADASTVGSTSRAESSNADLLNEIRMLREQMHAMEQRIQAPMGQPDMEQPPEYTKES